MKKIYLIALGLFATVSIAQVKVGGSPIVNPNAMFEVESTTKGMLLPRVALEATNLPAPLSATTAAELLALKGMTVYNTASTKDTDKVNGVLPGFYYHDGLKWNQMVTTDNKAVKFFYMPSITFKTDVTATGQTKNLYEEYKKQFSLPVNGNHAKSTNAPADGIPYFASPTDLYYYVTDYDPAVFSNIQISDEGVMTYNVTAAATDCSLINIVFVVK